MKKALVIAVCILALDIMGIALFQVVRASRSQSFWYPPVQDPAAAERERIVRTPLPALPPVPRLPRVPAVAPASRETIPAQKTNRQQEPKIRDRAEPRNGTPGRAGVPPFRIMIDPGHIRNDDEDKPGLPAEYVLTYKTAAYLRDLLEKDGRFYVELSRGPAAYNRAVTGSARKYDHVIEGILNEKVPFDRRFSWVPDEERKDLYGLRFYALEHGFDCLLSIHFDKVVRRSDRYRSRGFHLLVSPCNRDYRGSLAFAMALRSSMKSEYRINPLISYNPPRVFPAEVRTGIDPEGLKKLGISVRSILVLGDVYEYQYFHESAEPFPFRDIPSVLVESGFTHEKQFSSEEGLQELSRRLYEGIVQWYEKTPKRG